MITEPGLYRLTAGEYHADPTPGISLSNSVAQVLLDHSPRHAFLAHPKLNPAYESTSSRRLDLGSVAHALLLGQNAESVQIIEADSFRTKDAQKERDAARMEGKIPALRADYDTAVQMVAVFNREIKMYPDIVSHWLASQNEQTAVWKVGDVWCRAMIDATDMRAIFDFKTCANAHPDAVARQIYNMKYNRQEAWYRRALDAVDPDGCGRRKFYFIFQEIEEPFAVTIHETDGTGLEMANREIAEALETWAACLMTNVWPSYPRMIYRAAMPGWMEAQRLNRELDAENRRTRVPSDILKAG